MKLRPEPHEDFVLLHLQGEFDTLNCARFLQEIDDLLAAGGHYIALNLRRVKFISSTALGAILEASRRLGKQGGRLVISRPSSSCGEVMRTMGLGRVVPIYGSDEEARQGLLDGIELDSHGDPEGVPSEDSIVLFSPKDPGHVGHFIPDARRFGQVNPIHGHRFGENWRGIGRMFGIDGEGLRFFWNGGKARLSPFEMGQMLAIGTQLEVKFHLPLLQRGHHRAIVTVVDLEERKDGVKLGASFTQIAPASQTTARQYGRDMDFLKQELGKISESASRLSV